MGEIHGNGELVYETNTYSANITVHYKPDKDILKDGGSITYYKVENDRRGSSINKGTTWVLPNTYDLKNMTGIDVNIKYPTGNDVGVISGFKIELITPNGTVYYTDYWYTNSYDYTGRIPYDKLKRGISGNQIRITPFYIPSNVNKGNTGSYWYGPSVTQLFVDIAWMLNKPIIDCPLNNTIWHNNKYRILFKLPIDNDTNYKGNNDIENYYGSGNYRYQDIQLKINGTTFTLGNSIGMNAHNKWVSLSNISDARLTYKRAIIINPSLLSGYADSNTFGMSIRVRKAYGQNSNWDGWSEWSPTVTIKKVTVSNPNETEVAKGKYVKAAHYMNTQTALNNSISCYSKTASDNVAFVVKESFNRDIGHNINGPHLSPPTNTPLQTVKEYVSEFNDIHQIKNKINSYGTFDSDRNAVRLDSQNQLLTSSTPIQEFITAAKDQNGETSNVGNPLPTLKGRNYMKYMCDELNKLY